MKYFALLLFVLGCVVQWSFAAQPYAAGVCKCDDLCSLIPPSGSKYPCYQGAAADAAKCFQTDPLLASGTTWACGKCSSFGYPNYLQNDPLYKNMELWGTAEKK